MRRVRRDKVRNSESLWLWPGKLQSSFNTAKAHINKVLK